MVSTELFTAWRYRSGQLFKRNVDLAQPWRLPEQGDIERAFHLCWALARQEAANEMGMGDADQAEALQQHRDHMSK